MKVSAEIQQAERINAVIYGLKKEADELDASLQRHAFLALYGENSQEDLDFRQRCIEIVEKRLALIKRAIRTYRKIQKQEGK